MAKGSPSADLNDPGRARSDRAAHAARPAMGRRHGLPSPQPLPPRRAAQSRAQQTGSRNTTNPDQKVTAEQIPAGKSSEEVIGAAIVAGNAPCLIYNTAPAAVADFQAQGGLVDLTQFEDGVSYIETRSGDGAAQFASADGGYYQLPWKANPELSTFDDFIATGQTIVDSGAAQYAIYPAASSEFYQSWFDFYPIYAAG